MNMWETLSLLEENIASKHEQLLTSLYELDEDGECLNVKIDDVRTSLILAQTWLADSEAYSLVPLDEPRVRWLHMQDCLENLCSEMRDESRDDRQRFGSPPDSCAREDEKGNVEMVDYVDRVRQAAQSAKTAEAASVEQFVVLPTSGKHENTFIFLHGFKMEANEMLDVFVDISKVLVTWRFVLPQAPFIPITAHGGTESFAWFDYLTDHGGLREDTVDIFGLRRTKVELQRLVTSENSLLPSGTLAVLGGLSQGGTMALHMATLSDFKAVVTAVACRLSQSMARPLRCPWHAIVASEDDVFPSSWSQPLMTGATTIQTVSDSHYLEKTDITPLLLGILSKL
jgi:predicted esterase